MLAEEVPVKRAEPVIKIAQVGTPRSHDAQLSGAIVESICQAQFCEVASTLYPPRSPKYSSQTYERGTLRECVLGAYARWMQT